MMICILPLPKGGLSIHPVAKEVFCSIRQSWTQASYSWFPSIPYFCFTHEMHCRRQYEIPVHLHVNRVATLVGTYLFMSCLRELMSKWRSVLYWLTLYVWSLWSLPTLLPVTFNPVFTLKYPSNCSGIPFVGSVKNPTYLNPLTA